MKGIEDGRGRRVAASFSPPRGRAWKERRRVASRLGKWIRAVHAGPCVYRRRADPRRSFLSLAVTWRGIAYPQRRRVRFVAGRVIGERGIYARCRFCVLLPCREGNVVGGRTAGSVYKVMIAGFFGLACSMFFTQLEINRNWLHRGHAVLYINYYFT